MKKSKILISIGIFIASLFVFITCEELEIPPDENTSNVVQESNDNSGSADRMAADAATAAESEVAGNNLSFPVIWAEGTVKALRTPPAGIEEDGIFLEGAWWYVWGEDPIDPQAPLFSCDPVTTEEACYGPVAPDDLYKAYLQKDANNYWMAYNEAATEVMNVDWIDWGDNLESVDWTNVSKVRTEVALYEDMPDPVLEYSMRHASGWGIDESHGLQTTVNNDIVYGPGTQATVYSEHARLTIQKITSTSPDMSWDANAHAWVGDINAPVFSGAVWEAGDGPGYYNAEINVKGKIIYGYTWDVKTAGEGAGLYRITFSFDENGPATALNTYFDNNTAILLAEEEEVSAESDEETNGGVAVIDVANNLTYIDVNITAGNSGQKGPGNGGQGQGGNSGNSGNGGQGQGQGNGHNDGGDTGGDDGGTGSGAGNGAGNGNGQGNGTGSGAGNGHGKGGN